MMLLIVNTKVSITIILMHLLVSQSSFIVGASFVIMILLKLILGTCDKFCNFGVISNVGREKIGRFLHRKCDQQTWLRILTLFQSPCKLHLLVLFKVCVKRESL